MRVDNTAPANGVSLTSATGAYLNGTTVFYRGVAAGSFQHLECGDGRGLRLGLLSLPGARWYDHRLDAHQPDDLDAGGRPVRLDQLVRVDGRDDQLAHRAVTGADSAGNTTATTLTYTNDSTAPTGSLTSPAASSTQVGTVTLSANPGDTGSGVANVVFQRSPAGAGTWTAIGTASGSPYQVSWDTTGVADGLYDLRVVTTDNVGNTTTSAT